MLARARLVAASALLAAVGACGGPQEPPHWRVAQREVAWARDETGPGGDATRIAAPAPLTLAWNFGATAGAPGTWAPAAPATAARAERDGIPVLAVSGRGELDLLGPGAGIVDPDVHHWLTFRIRTTSARTVSVHWRNTGEDFSPSRRTIEQPLDATGAFATYQIALSGLRGIRDAADAADGVEQFRLRFRGADDSLELAVEVEQIALVSDYDALGPAGVHVGRLERRGVARQGLALRAPGSVALSLPGAKPGDRLRFALAVAGSSAPVGVAIDDRDGDMPEQHMVCAPGAAWTEHALELQPPSHGGTTLSFRVESAAAGARAQPVLLVGSVMRLERSAEARAPIVLYVEDTLRADHVTGAGYGHPTTPHLSQIEAQGASFTRAWAAANWTRPSVSSILTSLDPVAHGNQVHTRRVPESLVTLAEALSAQGYLTASFVTNPHAGAWSGLDQGFDAQGEPRAFGASDVTSTLTSDLIRDPIAAFLAEHADEQVFVFAHSFDPHAPYQPDGADVLKLMRDPAPRAGLPPGNGGDRARFDEATLDYDAEVLHNDHALAALDATLAATGLRERTLLAFVSDHGEAFADHGQWEHRQSLHEEELRVPWVVRLPGTVTAGARIDAPVSLLDLAPTLLGLVGLVAPPDWTGRDLSALCRAGASGAAAAPGSPGTPPARDAAVEGAPQTAAPRQAPIFADAVYNEPPRGGIRHEAAAVVWPWKLIATVDEHGTPSPEALFDLSADPAERADLLPRTDSAPQVAGLLAVIREHLERGPLRPAADADAAGMDPELREWMRAMGYLR